MDTFLRPAVLALLVFWLFGIVFSFVGNGNATWVRLLGAAGWTYLTFLLAKKWVVNRT
jgi:hypothetical protein